MFKRILLLAGFLIFLGISIPFSVQMAFELSTDYEFYSTQAIAPNGESYPVIHSIADTNILLALVGGIGTFIGCILLGLLIIFAGMLIKHTFEQVDAEAAIRELRNPSLRVERIDAKRLLATKGSKRYIIEDNVATPIDD